LQPFDGGREEKAASGRYDCHMKLPLVQRIGTVAVAIATPFVIVAAAVLLFLNPVWVGFDQNRSGVAALTGYSETQVHQVTGSILSDLVFGPPRFDVAVNGTAVLDERERTHMADVRNLLLELGGLALIAALVMVIAGIGSRGAAWFWRGFRYGARLTIVGVSAVGLAFVILFDQAFALFHEIFFAAGTYSFNTQQEKLVQLFPDQFWSETSAGIAAGVLILALIALYVTGRLATRRTAPDNQLAAEANI
jgi:integral membrane protein (TIGR01906 family)